MTVFEGLTLTLLTSCGIVLVLVLLTTSKILEGVNFILSICRANIVEDNPPDQMQPLIRPSDMPLSRDLMEIIGKPPEDGNTGTFQGRQPWGPPPETKV